MTSTPMGRRTLLSGTAMAIAAISLAGCTTTRTGGVTTITLDVARITAFAEAGLAAVTTVSDLLAAFPGTTAYTTPLLAAEPVLADALARFAAAAGSAVTIRYDDAGIATAVDSVLSDLQTIAGLIGAIVTQAVPVVSSDAAAKLRLAHDALTTIVATFRALLSAGTAMQTGPAPRLAMNEARMNETRALRLLRG